MQAVTATEKNSADISGGKSKSLELAIFPKQSTWELYKVWRALYCLFRDVISCFYVFPLLGRRTFVRGGRECRAGAAIGARRGCHSAVYTVSFLFGYSFIVVWLYLLLFKGGWMFFFFLLVCYCFYC